MSINLSAVYGITRCPYCHSTIELKDSSVIYGVSYGNVIMCSNYPVCDSYVGVHKEGKYKDKPLGRMANPFLRKLKKQTHYHFDKLWDKGTMTRKEAYKWLQNETRLSSMKAHIGEFSQDQCYELIEKLSKTKL